MTALQKDFFRLWESEMKGKQIPIAKKHEMRSIAWEWYFKGIMHMAEMFEKAVEKHD